MKRVVWYFEEGYCTNDSSQGIDSLGMFIERNVSAQPSTGRKTVRASMSVGLPGLVSTDASKPALLEMDPAEVQTMVRRYVNAAKLTLQLEV